MAITWASSAPSSSDRHSAVTAHSSATTLVAEPPVIVPMLAVVTGSIRPSGMAAMARAAAVIALRPCSGWIPACAAVPRMVMNISLCVGALITMPPRSPVWSYTNPKAARSTEGSKYAAPRSPTSSHGVNTNSMPAWGMPSTTTRSTA